MKMKQLIAAALLIMGGTTAMAQNTMTVEQLSRASQRTQRNPYSTNYVAGESQSFGTFFVEYNPHTWAVENAKKNNNYQGISIGFNYFTPFARALGFDAGMKLQYLFRQDKQANKTWKFEMLSATIPVDLAYDFRVSDGFAIVPYAGVYGRFNFTAKSKFTKGSGATVDYFDKSYIDPYKRFQFGFQAGLNFRISDMVTIGGGYWGDLSEITEHTKLHGFNVTLGANF